MHIDFLDKLSAAEQRDQERLEGSPVKTPQPPQPRKKSTPLHSQVKRSLKKLGKTSPLKKKRGSAAEAKLTAEQKAQEQRRREAKPSASDPARELAQHGYEVLGPIAAGAFSTILRARPVSDDGTAGEQVAVKTFDNAKCGKAPALAESRDRELQVLRMLAAEAAGSARHPHIAYMLAEHTGPNSTHAVLEYCVGGSLLRHMQLLQKSKAPAALQRAAGSAAGSSGDGIGMPEPQVARVAWQVMSALDYMHNLDVAHRDIKPGNILFDNEGGASVPDFRVKLCDFGFAVKCGNRVLKKLVGTPSYIAPELTGSGTESGYKGRPVDMWAIGVVLFEVLHGKPTFYGSNLEQLETRIRAVSHAPFNADVSAGARSIVQGCLKADPSKRLTSTAVLNHSWLKAAAKEMNNASGGAPRTPAPQPSARSASR